MTADAETREAVANIVRDLAIDLIASRIDELEIADRIIARLRELGWEKNENGEPLVLKLPLVTRELDTREDSGLGAHQSWFPIADIPHGEWKIACNRQSGNRWMVVYDQRKNILVPSQFHGEFATDWTHLPPPPKPEAT